MFFLKLIGVLLIISGGSAMTLHILKELKFIEISLWFAAISLFVVFLGKIYEGEAQSRKVSSCLEAGQFYKLQSLSASCSSSLGL